MVIQWLGRPLVKHPQQRTQGLVGFVILLVLVLQFLADHRAGLAAMLEGFCLDCFFIKLCQVVVKDESFVLLQALVLVHEFGHYGLGLYDSYFFYQAATKKSRTSEDKDTRISKERPIHLPIELIPLQVHTPAILLACVK